MQDMHIKKIMDDQRQYFATGETLPLAFRIEQLKKLKTILQTHEAEIADALKKDLHKAPMEAIVNEILLVTEEIDFIVKRLKKWMRPKKTSTPLPLWPGRSLLHYEPYGSVLIIGPWNYPFMLTMAPLIGAISAGNCVVMKPSEISINTQNIIAQLINDNFSSKYLVAIKGDPEQTKQLLQEKFDYIFFTGSVPVGKIVMEAAAKQLTPMTLELGGKSPFIVDETADLDFAARRLAWGKTTNAGQVCLAPDYLYVHSSCKAEFIGKLQHYLHQFYGDDPETSLSYGRIINKKHFERLVKLLQKGTVLFGGKTKEDSLYISPTLIDSVSWDDPIMQEEIFGPLLPIFTFDHLDEVIQTIKSKPKPLALYFFTQNKKNKKKMLENLSFGGGCVNDCIVQIVNLHLPFGGVGNSGMGHYHGKYSFKTFSHAKSIYQKYWSFDLKLEYPPYSEKKLWWLRRLFRL